MEARAETELPGDGPPAGKVDGSVTWQPIEVEECDCCNRTLPGWYETRNDHIADSLGAVSSRRLAKAYGISEDRVRTIAVEVLGKRAYIERVMRSEGWEI